MNCDKAPIWLKYEDQFDFKNGSYELKLTASKEAIKAFYIQEAIYNKIPKSKIKKYVLDCYSNSRLQKNNSKIHNREIIAYILDDTNLEELSSYEEDDNETDDSSDIISDINI